MAPQLWAMYVETCCRLCVEVTGIKTDAPKTLGLGLSFTWREKTTPMAAKVIMPVNFESWHHFTKASVQFQSCVSLWTMYNYIYLHCCFQWDRLSAAVNLLQQFAINLLQQYCAPHETY